MYLRTSFLDISSDIWEPVYVFLLHAYIIFFFSLTLENDKKLLIITTFFLRIGQKLEKKEKNKKLERDLNP